MNYSPVNVGYAMPPMYNSGFGMNPMASTMQMMLQVMTGLMSMMSGSATQPFSAAPASFGQTSLPYSSGSPLNGFLGGGSSSHGSHKATRHHGGGGSVGGGAKIPFNNLLSKAGPVSDKTKSFIKSALSKQGAPYVFGAEGPNKFDCSGLVAWALKNAGVKGGRTTAEGYRQRYKSTAVGRNQLKPGDLVFFHYPNSRGIGNGKASHIEIYLGNGKTMGTDNPREGARVENIDWKNFIGGARVPGLQG